MDGEGCSRGMGGGYVVAAARLLPRAVRAVRAWSAFVARAGACERALAADAADTRIVLGAQVALGGFAAAPADLAVERGAVALAHRRATLRADLAIELAPVFLAGGGATTLGRFGAGAWAGLAARGFLGRCWRASRGVRLLFGHIEVPFCCCATHTGRRGVCRTAGGSIRP